MDNSEKQYLSREKKKALEEELHQLKTAERLSIAKDLEYAKSLGDLSENAEYHEAREKQANLEERIHQLEYILKHAVVIQERHGDMVSVGSVVVARRGGGLEEEFMIVGSEEANIQEGKISHESPLGMSLLGKKSGENVLVKTPRGEVKYTVVAVK